MRLNQLFIKAPEVQECDARGDATSAAVWLIKNQ